MKKIDPRLEAFMNLGKLQAILGRQFDSHLGGLSFHELIILSTLQNASEEKMRRIDLAEAVGLTASGVTRLLLPMEKIGLVKKEVNRDDARVSLVLLAPGGKRKLEEGLERAALLLDDLFPKEMAAPLRALSEALPRLLRQVR